MSRTVILQLLLALLVGLAIGLTAPALVAGGNSTGLPDEGLGRRALEDYERAEREWSELERAFKEQRVKGRVALMEKEDLFRAEEREQTTHRDKEILQRRALEDQLAFTKRSPENANYMAELQAKIDLLKEKEAERSKRVAEVRKDVVVAEEDLRFLERLHAIQRRKALAKLAVAEARLAPGQVSKPTSKTVEDRLEALEEKMERLLRELEQLHREMRRRDK